MLVSMGGSPRSNAKPRPSYEDGELRDPKIAELADLDGAAAALRGLISKAVNAKAEAAEDLS